MGTGSIETLYGSAGRSLKYKRIQNNLNPFFILGVQFFLKCMQHIKFVLLTLKTFNFNLIHNKIKF